MTNAVATAMTARPVFRDLTHDECLAFLARHRVGRLAFTFHDRVDVTPVNYVMLDGDFVFRTAPGSKVDVLRHHPWVAFEVDEVQGLFEWRSVVAHGSMYHLDDSGNAYERESYARAVERLETLEGSGFSSEELESARPIVLRLHVDRMTGREARMPGREQAHPQRAHRGA